MREPSACLPASVCVCLFVSPSHCLPRCSVFYSCCLTIKMPCPLRGGAWGGHQVYLLRAQTNKTEKNRNFSCNELLIYLNSFHSFHSIHPSLTFHARPNDISLKRHQASNDIYADCISMSSSTSVLQILLKRAVQYARLSATWGKFSRVKVL